MGLIQKAELIAKKRYREIQNTYAEYLNSEGRGAQTSASIGVQTENRSSIQKWIYIFFLKKREFQTEKEIKAKSLQ